MADAKTAPKKEEVSPEILEMVERMVEAKMAAKKNADAAPDPGIAAETERMNEKVEIRLFKDNDRYKDDLFVAVNGVGYQIQRGVKVKVPRNVALVIEQGMEQDERTAALIEKESGIYERDVADRLR